MKFQVIINPNILKYNVSPYYKEMAEQVSSHTPEVGGGPQPEEVNTPVSPREERLLGKLTGVIRQTLEEHKKNDDKEK